MLPLFILGLSFIVTVILLIIYKINHPRYSIIDGITEPFMILPAGLVLFAVLMGVIMKLDHNGNIEFLEHYELIRYKYHAIVKEPESLQKAKFPMEVAAMNQELERLRQEQKSLYWHWAVPKEVIDTELIKISLK